MGRDFQGSTLCRHRESEHEGSRTKAGRQPGRFGDNHGRQWHRLLVQELLLAKQELSLPRLLRRLSKYEALIIDDIGYVEQSRQEMEVLFVLLAQRYERGSVMLTSNLPFSKWERPPQPSTASFITASVESAELSAGGLEAADQHNATAGGLMVRQATGRVVGQKKA